MDKKKHKIYRSSVSGEIVTKDFALANPSTTVCETIWIAPKPKPEFVPEEDTKKDLEIK